MGEKRETEDDNKPSPWLEEWQGWVTIGLTKKEKEESQEKK